MRVGRVGKWGKVAKGEGERGDVGGVIRIRILPTVHTVQDIVR